MTQIKYPKTPYLPYSPSIDDNDPVIDPKSLLNKQLVISIKMDGSNTTFTKDEVYGRSLHHASFGEIKSLHGRVKYMIPDGVHLFGESLVAKHSIHYTGNLSLNSVFMLFSVFIEEKSWFTGWDEVDFTSKETGLEMVQHILVDEFKEEKALQEFLTGFFNQVVKRGHEGIVVRNNNGFNYIDFNNNVAKMVRPHHVQGAIHWTKNPYVKNTIGEIHPIPWNLNFKDFQTSRTESL